MERTENKRRFPLFHSKSRYYDDCLWAFFHLAGADLPTTKPEAPLYFVEMVALEEARKQQLAGITVPIVVPSHHWIRGLDDQKNDEPCPPK